MKSIWKLLVVGLTLMLLLAVAGVVAAVVYIDTIAKRGIEQGATYVLDVPTTLDSADVGILSGTFGMSGLNVSNPQGFETPHFMNLGGANMGVSLGSLRSDTVEVPLIKMDGIDVNVEKREGKANYQVILENLERFESGDPSPEPASQGGGKGFIINRIEINNITASVRLLPLGGELATARVEVPQIVLENVGSDTDRGVLLSEIVNIITKAVLTSIVTFGGAELPGEILNGLQNGLGNLDSLGDLGVTVLGEGGKVLEGFGSSAGDILNNVGDGAQDVLEDAGKGVEDAVKGLGDGLNNLLGGGKDDDGG